MANDRRAQSHTAGKSAGGFVHSALVLLKHTACAWMDDNVIRLSAALSFYTFLSLGPLLLITAKLVGFVSTGGESARQRVARQIATFMGLQGSQSIQELMASRATHRTSMIAVAMSAGILIFSASGVFVELKDSMNAIWGVKPRPHEGVWRFVRNRLLSLGMIPGVAFLLGMSALVSMVLVGVAGHLGGAQTPAALVMKVTAPYCISALLFVVIYRYVPDARVRWPNVWPGALIAAGLFTCGRFGLAVYFQYAGPTSMYGAASSLAAVLLWVYCSAFSLFFGAEFTKVWSRRGSVSYGS